MASLEEHVKEYGVEVMTEQRAANIIAAEDTEDGYIHVELESGATLRARTVITSTGARWREMNVPGEQEYRNKGVAYCPHCDGPLFKGKKTAVIGGGNSGIEAAIDLAGIFVQIGLMPNSEWLKGSKVELSPRGEIEINAHGATSMKGVFAAGDVTTVPYKQIIIAMGEGAKASLGAFDHLIRNPAPVKEAETA